MEEILEAATHAPSAENRQPWVFVVVRDADDCARRSGRIYLSAWDSGASEHSAGRLDERLLAEVDRGSARRGGFSPGPA